MKWFIRIFVAAAILGWADQLASAQPSYGAEAYAQRQQAEQRWKKLSAQMEEMLASQELLRRRIQELEAENRRLTKKINDSNSSSVSPAELNKVVAQLEDQIQQVDKNRQSDVERMNRQLNKSIDELRKALRTRPAPTPSGSSGGRSFSGNYLQHTVESGQTIDAIMRAAKANGINVTTQEIIDANGGLDPRKLQVGQVIKIPIPK